MGRRSHGGEIAAIDIQRGAGPPAGSTFEVAHVARDPDLTSARPQSARRARGACVPVKRRNLPEEPRRVSFKPITILIGVASSLHGLDGGLAQRVGI